LENGMSNQLTRRAFLGAGVSAGVVATLGAAHPTPAAATDGQDQQNLAADDERNVLDIGTRKQLLADDLVIAATEGVQRVLHQATKANDGQPVRFWKQDDEDRRVPLKAWVYASPYYDEQRGVFRMWSRVLPDGRSMRYGYSESKDGVNFDFITELEGLHSNGDYNSVVYIDPHETDPAHRYKIGYDGAPPGFPNGACLAHSADGIHWTPYNDGKPVTGRAADFTNCLIWDEAVGTYRLFTRTDFGPGGGPDEHRGMRGMTNADVKANPTGWTTVRNWVLDREGKDELRRRQIYTMTDWSYCGVHFGLFSVYEWPGDFSEAMETDHVKRHERDVLNYYIATCRDGDSWDLTWIYVGRPLVERGGDGAWDKDLILPANWIVTQADRHWIYYGGANERHGTEGVFQPQRDGAIGLATLRLDGFISLTADEKPGIVLTRPFEVKGEALEVNVDAGRGELRVEVLDASGKPLPGYSGQSATPHRNVDELRLSPRWAKPFSELKTQTIRLRFRLRNAALYAFQVQE
jgi:hypothetical protein